MVTLMILLWALVGTACVGGVAYALSAVVLRRRRTICPSCGVHALDTYDCIRATVVDVAGTRAPAFWTKHRCVTCDAAYVRYNGGGLITKEAFDAGAREPVPSARLLPGRE